MKSAFINFFNLFILALLVGCAATQPYYAEEPAVADSPAEQPLYSVFLIGDAGYATIDGPNPPLDVLREKLLEAGKRSAVVFLGDNVYPVGLPPEEAEDRKKAENHLIAQMNVVKNYTGRVFFIPGNHDWANSGKDGLKAVQRMEEFIESYLDRGNVFLPDEGFPGPVDVKLFDKDDDPLLTRDIHLVALDTQWWLHPNQKSFGDTGEYDLDDSGNFLAELTDVMRDRQTDHVIVAAHHPLFSNGVNGGHFPAKRHLLPPVFGTGYVLYRQFFGLPQDISNYRYQSLKRELLEIFEDAESLVYTSGHDHVLQHTIQEGRREDQHYVISGTGSHTDYVAKGKGAEFAAQDRGFAAVKYYSDRSSWLEFWNEDGKLLYRRQMLAPTENPFVNVNGDAFEKKIPDLTDSTRIVAANPKYDEPGAVYRAILGSHNRRLWSIPVEAPVFDLSSVKGGLEVERLGGTGQSTTLRMTDSEGHSYLLRSIDKEAARVWDETLQNTLAEDLAQDQFSIINPYGAFMMPPLADAVGVYHTLPKLYVVPEDPRLGRFSDVMAGQLALFEERPDEDMSHAPHLSGSEEVISSRDLLRKVDGDIDHRVDQRMMLRNRLLDMLVSDQDRHEDQWRWASFEPPDEEGKIYQPIPRDRDMAFFFMNGMLPSIGKISFFSHYQDYRDSYGNLKGLTHNSLDLTRRFTNQLTKDDWIAIADSMKNAITEEVIKDAVSQMPEPVSEKEGSAIAHVLKNRRDKLPEVAVKYYDMLARVTDIVGSHKREHFIVETFPGDSVRVQVYKLKKDGERDDRYFDRTFYADETKELRLFGLGSDDLFEIRQQASDAINIRIIGGPGPDEFVGSSNHSGRIQIYDTSSGSTFRNIKSFRIHTSEKPEINDYDYEGGFRYNSVNPLLYLGSNRDDGIYLGGGAQFTRHGFRKDPAAAIHRIRGNFAFKTNAFNIRYDGFFGNFIGEWDAGLEMAFLFPNNIRNFYGLGNETTDESRVDNFYQARLRHYRIKPSIEHSLATGVSFAIGPHFQVVEVRDDEGRFVGQPQAGISENTFENQWFTGLNSSLGFQSVDSEINPMQGFRWVSNADLNIGIKNTSDTYTALSSALSMYYSPILNPQLTFATRIGVKHNIGPFPFYDSNTLGGKRTLRGLLSNRYSGRTSFFNNVELRTKVFDFQNYIFGGDAGVFTFFDNGRVWTDAEHSRKWHFGGGGGIWMNLFNLTVIRGSIGFSEGSYNVLIGAGFFF